MTVIFVKIPTQTHQKGIKKDPKRNKGRFKSQVLLDEQAQASCMAYVDLNPIRARMAKTPEQSDHTSIKRRIEQALKTQQPESLLAFAGNPRKDMPKGLPFPLTDYLELVDWCGRIIPRTKFTNNCTAIKFTRF